MINENTDLFKNKTITTLRQLPKKLPLALMGGLVLIPGSLFRLPLPDHGYLALISRMLKKNNFLGIIQPTPSSLEKKDVRHVIELNRIGTVAQPIGIETTEENGLVLLLRAVCRFSLKDHETDPMDFLIGHVSYQGFRNDLSLPKEQEIIFAKNFLSLCEELLKCSIAPVSPELDVNHPNFEPRSAITQLMMELPFRPQERQAVLEAENILDCYAVMGEIFKMSLFSDAPQTMH